MRYAKPAVAIGMRLALVSGMFVSFLSAQGQAAGNEQTIRQLVADQNAGKQVIAYTENRIFVIGPFARPSIGKNDPAYRQVMDSLGNVRRNVKAIQQIVRLEVAGSGDMAYEYGEGQTEYDDQNNQHTAFTNSYVRIWRKVNGQWLVDVFFARPNRQ